MYIRFQDRLSLIFLVSRKLRYWGIPLQKGNFDMLNIYHESSSKNFVILVTIYLELNKSIHVLCRL